MRTVFLGTALALGCATMAGATIIPAPLGNSDGMVMRTAEGCGPGWWRGPGGRCHPMARERACPRGYHLGPEGGRCWPNR